MTCVAISVTLACTATPQTTEASPPYQSVPEDPFTRARPGDTLSCTTRESIPQIAEAFDADWSPDSKRLAVTRIVRVPNPRTITGYEEEQRLSILDVTTGQVRELGKGNKPVWSGTGTYVAFWRDDLRVYRDGRLAAIVISTQPSVRWVGDDLYYFYKDELRVWHEGTVITITHVDPDLEPKYPRDDVSFSADAERFTMTRYFTDGSANRYTGVTATGVMTPLAGDGAVFTEWSPVGKTLLLRTTNSLTLRDPSADEWSKTLDAGTRLHGWTSDGRLLLGTMSPAVPGSVVFDRFNVYTKSGIGSPATLPNLLGARAFSPDGRFFAGTFLAERRTPALAVYSCGTSAPDARADTAARAHASSIDDGFLRPVSGAISQFLQGSHTGVDISAPLGSILVAADAGVVDEVGWVAFGGRRVCVQHAGGLESCHYHTSVPLVNVGERVVRGQPVALVGMTGLTAGPHTHFEVKLDGRIVDPLAY
jgi:murein DD-endopeptidase MepM/ murein hydrolase activator NlpD